MSTEIKVFNEKGNEVETMVLDEEILGKNNTKLLHQIITGYEANLHLGTHKTKSKAERRGSGAKPWKQKHTGRARAGMKRSPLWKGGGNIFGTKIRDYIQKLPVEMRAEACKSALLSKIQDQQFKVIDTLIYNKPSTKRFIKTLKALGLHKGSCLVAIKSSVMPLIKSVRNIEKITVIPFENLNAYEIVRHKNLLVTKGVLEDLILISSNL